LSKVVVVEDSTYMRSVVCAIAADAGHEVVATASNGLEGHAAVLEHDPDCLLTDLLMPEQGGLDMIEALRDGGWDGHVIVLSADVQKSTVQKYEDLGVVKFLHKPPDRDELALALGAVVSP
jgi:two-component system chemotaxis response regulator CheY